MYSISWYDINGKLIDRTYGFNYLQCKGLAELFSSLYGDNYRIERISY